MIKRILVPLDGTKLAERALPYAIWLANQYQATLLLKRVVQLNSFSENFLSWEGLEKTQMEAVQDCEIYLAQLKECVTNPQHKLTLEAARVETLIGYGKSVEIISELLKLEKVDLVVMTTHGRGGLSQLVMGSTAAGIVHNSDVPVMLIRPDRQQLHDETDLESWLNQPESLSLERAAEKRRILVALDGYEYAEQALTTATDLATTLQANLHIIEVVAPPTPTGYAVGYGGFVEELPPSILQEQTNLAYDYLTKVQQRLSEAGLRAIKVVRTGNPATEIADYAIRANAMCVVMATHAPGRVERAVIGSTAQEVLRRSQLPVVMVHPAPRLAAAPTETAAAKPS